MNIMHGRRPRRPASLSSTPFFDCIWSLIERCWAQEEEDRPSMEQVILMLEESSPHLHHQPFGRTLTRDADTPTPQAVQEMGT
jgi:hypothetical protein